MTTDQKFKKLVDLVHASEIPQEELLQTLEELLYDWDTLEKEEIIAMLGKLELSLEVFRQGVETTREAVLIATIDQYEKGDLDIKIQEDDFVGKFVECDQCDGCGWYEGGPTIQTFCKTCNGTGKIKVEEPDTSQEPNLCTYCEGRGEIFVGRTGVSNAMSKCTHCGGSGKQKRK